MINNPNIVKSLVSVIIPCFNQASYLLETLESVLNQSYTKWECIILNDGSTDDTEDVAKKYCELDKRFKYIYQKNSGPSIARNVAIAKSRGEFILPLDSDDLISENYLQDAVEIFINHPETKLVYCQAELIGKATGLWKLQDYSYERLLSENMIFCSAMYRRSDFDKTGGYNENMKEGLEDWDFWLSFLKREDVVYRIPKVCFFYRIKENSRNFSSQEDKEKTKRMHTQIFLNHVDSYDDLVLKDALFKKENLSVKPALKENNFYFGFKFFDKNNRIILVHILKRLTYFFVRYVKMFFVVMKRDGFGVLLKRIKYAIKDRNIIFNMELEIGEKYHLKRILIENDLKNNRNNFKERIKLFQYKPLISIVMPVYNVEVRWLKAAIDSVLAQYYDNWELCIVDDASTKEEIKPFLDDYAKKDKRIKVKFLEKNLHISGSSNEALKMAKGEFVALLDNDDEITPDALFEVVSALNQNESIDVMFSDEDKIDENGKFCEPMYKPEWSLDRLLHSMYTGHLAVYRKTIIDKIGGFRLGYEGSQDYDLMLRFVEQTENVHHIKKVLYHWRKVPTSVSLNSDAKSYAYEAGIKALEDYLQRNKIKGKVEMLAKGLYEITG